MNSLQIDHHQLVLNLGQRVVRVDLTRAVRARMWNRSEIRPYVVSEFAVARIDPLADGLRVMLVNQAEGLFIPVTFRPAPDGLRVTVPAEICELNGINRKLMELDLLPELVTSRVGQAGWFLLPCFSGTLVEFKDQAATINRDRLYMDQAEWEKLCLMNCFAANVAGEGVLAIVHRGDFFCHVTTEINQAGVNRIYPSFGLRHRESEPIPQQDKELILHFASGPQAEWPALAKIYRDYLVRERGVVPLKARLSANPVLAYSVAAMRVKIFMGIKQGGASDGSSPLRVDTTFDQAEAILDRMKAAGMRQAVVTLVGWNIGGLHNGAYPQRFPVEPALGGEAGLRKLIIKAKGLGYQIVPHDNLTDMYLAGQTYDPEVVLRHEDNTRVLGGIWGGGQAVKACPVAYFDRYGADVTRIKDLGFEGHYYCDAQSNPLFRCHDPRHPADEEQFGLSQCKLTQAYRVLYGAVSQEMSPAYALPFIDEAAWIPCPGSTEGLMNICPETFRRVVSRLVPFYGVAVHGLITYQDGWTFGYRQLPGGVRQGWLRALSYGARPCMHLSWTGAYDCPVAESLSDIREPYRVAFEELADTHAELIEDYKELAPAASRIRYANGTTVAVNWGATPFGELAPLSYHVERHTPPLDR